MAKKITVRDWEALSAYLDRQLKPQEGKRLEIRLRNEPELRAALEELRHTRTVLRSQPRLRAPRNFTLSPQMAGIRAGQRPMPSAYPALRLAALLATFFFALVFVGDLLLGVFQPAQIQMIQDPQQQAMQPGWPGFGGGGGGGGGGSGQDLTESIVPPAEEPALESKPAEKAAETALDMPASGAAVTATATLTSTLAVELEEGLPSLTPTPVENQIEQASGWRVLQLLQIVLALLAVITGLAALYLRRSAGR